MGNGRVLVVDDDASIRETVSWILREHGYDVSAVGSAAALFAELEVRMPDLLLLDVMMPEVDGIQVLERLKADEQWRELPVLMLSALPAEEAMVTTLGLGASDFVRKPFDVEELLLRVRNMLDTPERWHARP